MFRRITAGVTTGPFNVEVTAPTRQKFTQALGAPILRSVEWLRSQGATLRPEVTFGFRAPKLAALTVGAALVLGGCGVERPLSVSEFTEALSATSDREVVIKALFEDPEFKAMWSYLGECRVGAPKAWGSIDLQILEHHLGEPWGFGLWRDHSRTLLVSDDHPAYDDNPQELVDTLTHEVIHAVTDLAYRCAQAGFGASPLGEAGNAEHSHVSATQATPEEDHWLRQLGPSPGKGCTDYLDINAEAQRLVVRVVRRVIAATGVGGPTLTFANDKLREDPQAFAEYQACRTQACALPKPEGNQAALECLQAVPLN